MKKNNEYFKDIISILKELNKKYPNQGLGRHLHDATLEYKNIWGINDKEFYFALTKYKAELDLNVVNEEEVDLILKDGLNITADKVGDYLIDDTDWDNQG